MAEFMSEKTARCRQGGRMQADTPAQSQRSHSPLQAYAAMMAHSPQAAQLRAIQAMQGPAQLLKRHASTFIDQHGLGIGRLRADIERYVNDASRPSALRRGLMMAWNKGRQRQPVVMPADLAVKGGAGITGGKRLARSDSFDVASLDYETELNTQKGRKKIVVANKSGARSVLPVFDNVDDSTRMVRAFGHHFAHSGALTGPQFALNLGPNFGLFEAPRGNDMVYVPLVVDPKTGDYFRQGGIFNWSDHAKHAENANMNADEVRSTLKGELAPESALVLSTVGAMVCDAKTSLTGYQDMLKDFYESKESAPTKLFSSVPAKRPLWRPSVLEGRGLPGKRKAELERRYLSEIATQALLTQNNCLINAISLAAGRPMATMAQLVSIRIASASVGEMLLASPAIITLIRSVLNIPNAIDVFYVDRIPEHFDGEEPALTIYHNGENHFTGAPDDDKSYRTE